jgi:hypothetical protein
MVVVSGNDACHCSTHTPTTNAISAASLTWPASGMPWMQCHSISLRSETVVARP